MKEVFYLPVSFGDEHGFGFFSSSYICSDYCLVFAYHCPPKFYLLLLISLNANKILATGGPEHLPPTWAVPPIHECNCTCSVLLLLSSV